MADNIQDRLDARVARVRAANERLFRLGEERLSLLRRLGGTREPIRLPQPVRTPK